MNIEVIGGWLEREEIRDYLERFCIGEFKDKVI